MTKIRVTYKAFPESQLTHVVDVRYFVTGKTVNEDTLQNLQVTFRDVLDLPHLVILSAVVVD